MTALLDLTQVLLRCVESATEPTNAVEGVLRLVRAVDPRLVQSVPAGVSATQVAAEVAADLRRKRLDTVMLGIIADDRSLSLPVREQARRILAPTDTEYGFGVVLLDTSLASTDAVRDCLARFAGVAYGPGDEQLPVAVITDVRAEMASTIGQRLERLRAAVSYVAPHRRAGLPRRVAIGRHMVTCLPDTKVALTSRALADTDEPHLLESVVERAITEVARATGRPCRLPTPSELQKWWAVESPTFLAGCPLTLVEQGDDRIWSPCSNVVSLLSRRELRLVVEVQ